MANHLFDGLMANADPERAFARMPDGRWYTYQHVIDVSARFANRLVELGVKPGDRVAVQVPKSIEAVMLYFGVVRTGAIFLPLNTAYTAAEIEYFLGNAEPSVFVCDPKDADGYMPLTDKMGIRLETMGVWKSPDEFAGTLLEAGLNASPEFTSVARGPDDLAAILYTSGTTGRSKGAMLTHDNLVQNVLSACDRPVILHWLGEMFDPELAGYWGVDDFETAMETALAVIDQNVAKVDGIKISLLDKEKEIAMRRRLPAGVKMYTGDDFIYPELIAGDEEGYSHALLGIFDPLAVAVGKAVGQLGAGDVAGFRATLDPTVRRLDLPDGSHVVLADTVGFVRDLPHELIAAFRSTLQEAREADLILHVIDASDPNRWQRVRQVNSVLEQLGADRARDLELLRLRNEAREDAARRIGPDRQLVPV